MFFGNVNGDSSDIYCARIKASNIFLFLWLSWLLNIPCCHQSDHCCDTIVLSQFLLHEMTTKRLDNTSFYWYMYIKNERRLNDHQINMSVFMTKNLICNKDDSIGFEFADGQTRRPLLGKCLSELGYTSRLNLPKHKDNTLLYLCKLLFSSGQNRWKCYLL